MNSNETSKPLVLKMKGSVEQVYTADPENPRIEVVRGTESPGGKITLKRASKTPAKVVEITSASAVIKPTLRVVEEGSLYEIELAIDLGANKRNYFYENISAKVETDGQVIDLPLRVTVIVKDRIDVAPKSAYFPRKATADPEKADAAPLEKILDIKSPGGPDHSFKITGVEHPESDFVTAIKEVEPGKHYQLVVTLPKLPESKARTVRERITIKTDDPSQPEIKVTAMAIFGATGASPLRTGATIPRRTGTTVPARTGSPALPQAGGATPSPTTIAPGK